MYTRTLQDAEDEIARLSAAIETLHASAEPFSTARTPIGRLAAIHAGIVARDLEIASDNRAIVDQNATIAHYRAKLEETARTPIAR